MRVKTKIITYTYDDKKDTKLIEIETKHKQI